MAPQLRALTVPEEDLESTPSDHVMAHSHSQSLRVPGTVAGMHIAHIHACKETLMQKKKRFLMGFLLGPQFLLRDFILMEL